MKQYVLGFVFHEKYSRVWLIEKNRPAFQKGKLNGAGGKVEEGENIFFSMNREFREEGKLDIPQFKWNKFCTFSDGSTYEVHCFSSYSDEPPTSMTDEIFRSVDVDNLPNNVMYNLHWLIPMAKQEPNVSYYVKEEHIKNWPKENL